MNFYLKLKSVLKKGCIILLGFSLLLGVGCKPENQQNKHRVIFNSDGTYALGNFRFNQRPLTLDDLNVQVDELANTQVTTFMMCPGSDYQHYRSKYGRVFGDDVNGTLDCGCDTAHYKYIKSYYQNHLNLEKEGTDVIGATLRQAKEKGMEAFITYRMNDLHFTDTALHCPIVYSKFWVEHPEYWLNEDIGWHSKGALDFSIKEVREQKLNMITEQLEKYEMIDGYDLDFCRFFVYFKSDEGEKNAHLMTDLVVKIKAKVDKISAKRGKKILLSARVPPDLDFSIKKGLDVNEWLRLELFDFISTAVHWRGNPSMPVEKFKKSLVDQTIPVYTTIDDGGYKRREFYSHGMYRGMASHILAQGGDGIYLFNFFFDSSINEYRQNLEKGGYVSRKIVPDLLHELGSLETLRARNKIYCLDDGSSAAYGYKPDTPLPLSVSPENYAAATIFIGDDTKKDIPEEVILFFRSDKPAQFNLSVNGVKVEIQKPEYIKLYDKAERLKREETVYAYILPASCLKQGDNSVYFDSSNPKLFKIIRLEIALKYGDVETHGYF